MNEQMDKKDQTIKSKFLINLTHIKSKVLSSAYNKKGKQMVKKEQYKAESQQQESYFSDDKYQPDAKYEQSSDDQSEEEGVRQVYSEQQSDQAKQQDEAEEVQQKLSILQKQEERIRQQLKQLPYGLILKQRQQLQKQKNQITQKISKKKLIQKNNHNDKNKNRPDAQPRDKHAPKQVSIHKRPPKKTPTIFQSSRVKSIDPRFEDYAGFYNEDLAKKSMDFIPKLQEEEIKQIRKTLDQSKGTKKNTRNKKKLSERQRKVLIEEYNKLTNEKRQNELGQMEKQVKRNIRNQQQQYHDRNSNSYGNNSYGNNSYGNNSYGNNSYGNNSDNRYSSNNESNRYSNSNNRYSNSNNDKYNNNNNNRYPDNNNRYPDNNNRYSDNNSNNQRRGYIPKEKFKQQFQKVKQSRMSDQQRKDYLKNKEKNIYKNQQVDRNNMMYETSARFKQRQSNKFGK